MKTRDKLGFKAQKLKTLTAAICLLLASCGPKADPLMGRPSEKPQASATVDSVSGATGAWVQTQPDASAGDEQWSGEAPSKCEGPLKSVLGNRKENLQGPIRFDHCAHLRAGVRCSTCHHEGSGGKTCGGGDTCHKIGASAAPNLETAFHNACRPCHLEQRLNPDCSFCHLPGQEID